MAEDTPSISVVICAYTEERWTDLVAAVASLRRQRLVAGEIIVVIDHNPALFERAHTAFGDARVIENQGPRGLSGARNTGIDAAQGDLIAFLDDDAIADTSWLEWLVASCAAPEVLGCGGWVEPAWEGGEPLWFPREFAWVVGCSYRGLPTEQHPVRNLIGASMCMRREVFSSVGLFRSDLGRIGKYAAGCEETELCIRAQQHTPGKQFILEPRARVTHHVPASRGTWRYFRSRCYAEGLSKAMVARYVSATDGLESERSYVSRTLPRGVVHGLYDGLARRDLAGFLRAGAIIGGLVLTTSGYVVGTLMLSMRAARETRQASTPEPPQPAAAPAPTPISLPINVPATAEALP